MKIKSFIHKANRKIWQKLVSKLYGSALYPYLYLSFWNSLIHKKRAESVSDQYFTSRPNPGAGIGHQMANWNAGYWYARQLGLKFAHLPFAQEKWESVLGFGESEANAEQLIKKQGYKKVLLPLFDEHKSNEIVRIKDIIGSYQNKKVVFIAEQDQAYQEQFGVIDSIQTKFRQAKQRKEDKLIYIKDTFNIAIHVRRGDIEIGQQNQNPNLLMRWQNNSYFRNVLTRVIKNLKTDKPVAIYLFSQGKRNDFAEFEKFENIHFCLDMNAQESFIHMAFADLLITSKSSFSYKPALLNTGIKICPSDFWHGYPKKADWILADDNGDFEINQLNRLK
jgi:hypothetical protein